MKLCLKHYWFLFSGHGVTVQTACRQQTFVTIILLPHTITPPPKLGVGNPQSKHCIENCGQMVPDHTRVVCIDSLWVLSSSLPNDTIVDPLGHSFPQNWGNKNY